MNIWYTKHFPFRQNLLSLVVATKEGLRQKAILAIPWKLAEERIEATKGERERERVNLKAIESSVASSNFQEIANKLSE